MSEETKRCPYCDEEISKRAIKCKHCGSMLQTPAGAPYDTLDVGPVGASAAEGRLLSGRYRIVKELARGGMGVVCLARDEELDMKVAVKFLPMELANDRRALEQLRTEARLSMSLSHPNIMRLHTLDTSGLHKFLVMEYVDGPNLLDVLREKGKLPLERIIPIIKAVCEGVDYAHANRVLHRDLKPANIMVTARGEVKIADFGIARQMRESMSKLSQGAVMGTPAYMAPENLMGGHLTVRSDIYSLGAVTYELLVGHPPFFKGDILAQIRFKEPPPIRGVPEPVDAAIMAALAKDALDRPASAAAFYKSLSAATDGKTPKRSRATLHVPADYPTIQAGIDHASDGDFVIVADGIYTGEGNRGIDFRGKAVTLRSQNGPVRCIIDCQNSGRAFHFHSGEDRSTVVEHFTIQNGKVIEQNGGGILCEGSSSPVIRNCTIKNCRTEYYSDGGRGGGICCHHNSNPSITNCTLANNSAEWGGGLYCRASNPSVVNCTIVSNSAGASGGGVDCYHSSPTIANCILANNLATFGGGVCCFDNCSPMITNCTLTNNTASWGGAVRCYKSSPVVSNSILWANRAAQKGNQLCADDASSAVVLKFCDFPGRRQDPNRFGGGGATHETSCIHEDPKFLDAAAGNYRLQRTSPCIDKGSNDYVPERVAVDLDDNPRITDGDDDGAATVDIGAYEYQP